MKKIALFAISAVALTLSAQAAQTSTQQDQNDLWVHVRGYVLPMNSQVPAMPHYLSNESDDSNADDGDTNTSDDADLIADTTTQGSNDNDDSDDSDDPDDSGDDSNAEFI